jgi:glycosyltransferase involved in cell wall biosynthesis
MDSPPLRIAFLTAAFVTEPNSGGMGAYLHRLTKVLHELGHEPEVFTFSQEPSSVITFDKIRVERVGIPNNLPLRMIRRLSRLTPKLDISETGESVFAALGLAHAFYARDREKPFDLVQSSDYGLTGLFIKKDPCRRHLVRCSWAADLFIRVDGKFDKLNSRLYCWFERYCIRKSDVAYAPSEFVAGHYKKEHGFQMQVLRPPFELEMEMGSDPSSELPQRYLFYFGAICPPKGTDVLAAALPIAWRQEPELTMVWAGESWNGAVENYRHMWGEKASHVRWLGYIPKPQLYTVLKRAEAVVIPSRVDNLPNTLIESLLLDVPIIGSHGASIDELVEPGRNGELVQIGDPKALANTMLKVWRREGSWKKREHHRPSVLKQMEPRVAAANFLRLGGMPTERLSPFLQNT